ncbi:hypothetical protein SNARM312S_07343 [Streptomyces narbonensis]
MPLPPATVSYENAASSAPVEPPSRCSLGRDSSSYAFQVVLPRASVLVSSRSRWSYVIRVVPVSGSVAVSSRPRWSNVHDHGWVVSAEGVAFVS